MLLIDCHGDYWHSREDHKRHDKAKASYITNNFSHKYSYKVLWEHEFKCLDRVAETIKYWLCISEQSVVDFKFEDLEIKDCSADDYKPLLAKYHWIQHLTTMVRCIRLAILS